MINEVTNSQLVTDGREGKKDMCRAIDEMRRKSRDERDCLKLFESARNLI